MPKAIVLCEESGKVREALRKVGVDAYSCDLLPSRDNSPHHYQCDARELLKYYWDLIIAHPPCTYLAVSGACWMYHPDDRHLPTNMRRPHPLHPHRRQKQEDALAFVKEIALANSPRIAIENPISVISSRLEKPTQIIKPLMFGHPSTKQTCLWLKGLPLLKPTKVVEPEYHVTSSGRKWDKWWFESSLISQKDGARARFRSETFQGIADAMADQWGRPLVNA